MPDAFDNALNKYRKRIKREGPSRLHEDLAAGRIALPHKIRAAQLALENWQEIVSEPSFFQHPIDHLRKHWQFWVPTAISLIGTIIAAISLF